MWSFQYVFGICCLISVVVIKVDCQYGQSSMEQVPMDYYKSVGGGSYDTDIYQHEPEVDERPKINLGIRLKIPAIKFELPRFNMPKITVSAKIRQPSRPRVISLPEINLDTHSSSVTNDAVSSGKTAPRSYSKSMASYGGSDNKPKAIHQNQEQEQTLTFSTETETKLKETEEEQSPEQRYWKKNSRATQKSPSYNLKSNSHYQPQQHAIAYASSHQSNHLSTGLLPSDLGFDAPIYVKPKDSGQPIEAYGRRPFRVMSYGGDLDNFRNPNFLSAQKVFADTRSMTSGYFVR